MNTENSLHSSADFLTILADAYSPLEAPHSASEHYLESAGILAGLLKQLPVEYYLPLRYHEARLLAMADRVEVAVEILDELLRSKNLLPEAIWLYIQLAATATNEATNRLRWSLEDQLGAALPISAWGLLRNAKLEGKEADRTGQMLYDSCRPAIPILDSEKLLHIASLFEEMEMNAEAASAYREALYGAFAPPNFPEFGDESWLSSQTSDTWLATARIEAMLGQEMWSMQALLMAVASSRSQLLTAKQLLGEILNKQSVIPEPVPNVDKLTRIAMLYRDCNLHPRAISSLDEAAKIPEADVSELRDNIENAWGELVASYIIGKESISFLFGYKVSEHTARLKLSPSPFPYENETGETDS